MTYSTYIIIVIAGLGLKIGIWACVCMCRSKARESQNRQVTIASSSVRVGAPYYVGSQQQRPQSSARPQEEMEDIGFEPLPRQIGKGTSTDGVPYSAPPAYSAPPNDDTDDAPPLYTY